MVKKSNPKSAAGKTANKRVGKTSAGAGDEAEIDRIRRLIRSRGESLLALPNVTSVGIGLKQTDARRTTTPSLQFSVERKVSPEGLVAEGLSPIPKTIDFEGVSIPTDVVERKFRPGYTVVDLKPKAGRKSRVDPLYPGVSIGNRTTTAGTLGAVVRDAESGAPVLLSNWHVFCGAKGNIGEPIVQPGPFDDDRVEANVVGTLLRSHVGLAGDCAIASVDGRKADGKILELGVRVESVGKPALGDVVIKSGRTTGVTYGQVSRIDALFKVPYDGVPVQTVGGFEIEPVPKRMPPGGEISKGGDSGAAWMAVDARGAPTTTMLGLHFGGDAEGSDGEFALACYAHSVFEKLEIEPLGVQPALRAERAGTGGAATRYRKGFDSSFLDFEVPRPGFSKAVADDLIGVDGENWIDYCHFTVWLSKSRKLPCCVAWNIDGARKRSLPRKGISFVKDERDGIDEYQFGDELYASNDLDRGHVARRDDLVWGGPSEAQQGNVDSFFFTNMTPQHQAFNQSKLQGQWGLLENAILDEVALKDLRVSVMGGPILAASDRRYREAKIPAEYWKIVFFVDDEDGEHKARAFILTQRDLLKTLKPESLELEDFRWYQVPIATIEKRTGIKLAAPLRRIDVKFPQALGVEQARLIVNGDFFG